MYIEHLNLVVTDLDASMAFYQAAFPEWRERGRGQQEWFGKSRTWLHFGDDNYYLTFCNDGEGDNRDLTGHQTGLAHFAFVVTNLKTTEERLHDAGFSRSKDGQSDPYRSNVYYLDPNGFEVEFVQYHSDLYSERNCYA